MLILKVNYTIMRGDNMTEIRNLAGKLVCRVDEVASAVEIVSKGHKTSIRFNESGTAEVTHEKTK